MAALPEDSVSCTLFFFCCLSVGDVAFSNNFTMPSKIAPPSKGYCGEAITRYHRRERRNRQHPPRRGRDRIKKPEIQREELIHPRLRQQQFDEEKNTGTQFANMGPYCTDLLPCRCGTTLASNHNKCMFGTTSTGATNTSSRKRIHE